MKQIQFTLTVFIVILTLRAISTTVRVTAYDGSGTVQQQPLTLVCNYTKDILLFFNWLQGNTIIVSGSIADQTVDFQDDTAWTSGVFLGDFTSSLTINLPASSVTRAVAGLYTCNIGTLDGTFEDTATATVYYAPEIDSTFPSSRNVTEFDRLQIDCSSYTTPGNPAATSYTWTYGGSTVTSGALLDINNVGRDRGGQYTCTTSNRFTPTGEAQQQGGAAEASVSVDVQYGPGNSVQANPEGSTARVEGSGPFSATCTADCNPACSISWRRDSSSSSSSSSSSNNSINISNVTRTDQGTYTCQAQNIIGEPREKSFTLVVYYLYRPVLSLDKTEVEETDAVNLSCEVDSNPTAEMVIRNLQNQTVLVEGETNSLQFTIDRVQCLHNGTFVCSAGNSGVGDVSSSDEQQLNVLCKPRPDPRQPLITSVRCREGDVASLALHVISNPPPRFVWYLKDHQQLVPVPEFTQHSLVTSLHSSVLQILVQNTRDYGEYVAEVTNNVGSVQVSFTVSRLDAEILTQESDTPGLGAGVGIGICVMIPVVVLAIVATCFFFRRRQTHHSKGVEQNNASELSVRQSRDAEGEQRTYTDLTRETSAVNEYEQLQDPAGQATTYQNV